MVYHVIHMGRGSIRLYSDEHILVHDSCQLLISLFDGFLPASEEVIMPGAVALLLAC